MKYYLRFNFLNESKMRAERVTAIKELRYFLGFGLKEAKDYCDMLWDGQTPVIELTESQAWGNNKYYTLTPVQDVIPVGLTGHISNIKKSLLEALPKVAEANMFSQSEDILQMLKIISKWET